MVGGQGSRRRLTQANRHSAEQNGAGGANHALSYWQQNDRGGWVQAQ